MFGIMMIRGVQESAKEVRMTFDVPSSAQAGDLKVMVQDNLLQVACGPDQLTLPIHDVDANIHGIWLPGQLEVVAPKNRDDDSSGSSTVDEGKPVRVVIQDGRL